MCLLWLFLVHVCNRGVYLSFVLNFTFVSRSLSSEERKWPHRKYPEWIKIKTEGCLKTSHYTIYLVFFFLILLDELTSLFCLYLSGWVEQQRKKIQWRKRHRWWEIFPCFINFVFLIIWGVILVTKLFNIPVTCAFYHTQKSGDVNCTRKTPRVR